MMDAIQGTQNRPTSKQVVTYLTVNAQVTHNRPTSRQRADYLVGQILNQISLSVEIADQINIMINDNIIR